MSRITDELARQRSICKEGERFLRAGDIKRATALLKGCKPSQAMLETRLGLAKLARRTGQTSLGLRLLYGHLRPEERSRAQASLVAEYAVLLLENGGLHEAEQLLRRSDARLHPDLLLAQAWCLFEAWNYGPSLPLLREYIDRQEDPYFRLAGMVNLGEAYLATHRISTAIALLGSAIRTAEAEGYARLLANALHIRARAFFLSHRLDRSDQDLLRAKGIFGENRVSDAILVKRQWAINRASEKGALAPLRHFREEALASKAWESVRECDFEKLRIRFDQSLFDRLYYGTPHEQYRLRLGRAAGRHAPSASFYWGDRGMSPLDLSESRFSWRGRMIRLTPQTRALLYALLSDFYRPVRVGSLFARLFPREYFDPSHSPARVHQALRRLRLWLAEQRIPLKIECRAQCYFLSLHAPFAVRLPLSLRHSIGPLDQVEKLQTQFKGRPSFSAKEAREALALPKATTTRHLQTALAVEKIERMGRGKNTRYRVLS